MNLILGVDLGTSSIKVTAFNDSLSPLHTSRHSYPMRYTADGGAEQDAHDWWEAFSNALKDLSCHVPLEKVVAVGFSGYNALVGVNASGEACGPALTYLDKRVLQKVDHLKKQVSSEEVFARTKNRLSPGGTWAPALCWIREKMPNYWEKSRVFVSSSGYVAGQLTKTFAVDGSRASLTLLHDPAGKQLVWDEECCRMLGIPSEKLPPIFQSWETIGVVQPEAARLTGLPSGIPVVIGGMDSMCAALGSGILDETLLFDIGGSAGGLAGVSTRFTADERFFNVRFVLPGRWANIGPLSAAGSAWKWLQQEWLGHRFESDKLLQRAAAISPGSEGVVFFPYLAGARCPYWDLSLEAAFYGMTMNHHVGHMARAVLEGVAFAQKEVFDGLCQLGYAPREVRAAGGGAHNDLWMQIKADILGVPHSASAVGEASAYGAALLAAYGLGIVPDVSEHLRKDTVGLSRWNYRKESHEIYMNGYVRWRRIRDTLYGYRM